MILSLLDPDRAAGRPKSIAAENSETPRADEVPAVKRQDPTGAMKNARATWAVNGEFRTPVRCRIPKTRDESGVQSLGVYSGRRRFDPGAEAEMSEESREMAAVADVD